MRFLRDTREIVQSRADDLGMVEGSQQTPSLILKSGRNIPWKSQRRDLLIWSTAAVSCRSCSHKADDMPLAEGASCREHR